MAFETLIDTNPDFASKQRRNIFRTIIVLLAIVFIGRLGYMQIIQGSAYKLESESQAIKQVVVEPFRGDIYDRNGDIIVNNEPSFTLSITKNDFTKESLILLSSILEMDSSEINEALLPYKNVSKFTPIKLFRDLDFQKTALIEEYNDLLPGVEIVVDFKRLYNFYGNMAHLLGYSREVSEVQLKQYPYYKSGDVIGQTGLEKEYEEILRGNKGIKFVTINKLGKKVASFDNGRNDIPSRNGFDMFLTIDKKLQAHAETLLKGKRGALVALNPNNGEILAIASKPDYNPRDFAGKIPSDLFHKLINDPAYPMYNRSIMSAYPPGSTWKMLVALAALQEGIIDINSTVNCRGSIQLGFKNFKCHGAHGTISVRNAIKVSCNVFFYETAMKLGFEKMLKWARIFGFGDKTFVDIPSESKGKFPSEEWLINNFGSFDEIPAGYLANYGIGQGEIAATPIQMALYASAIATKGTIYQPHVVRYIHNNITNKIEPISYDKKEIPIDKKYFDIVQKGMWDVVNSGAGTASSVYIQGIEVCGKTGTAQNPHGRDHSWFICFAPMKNPQIAICVFVENAGFGGVVAAPIARNFLMAYFYPDSYKIISPPSSTFTDPLDSISNQITDKIFPVH
ncbi:MAG: penicillin-binding protein 2 [Ignavibacteria bacterium GWB2_35_12]|nr:MAG: penicillin-binding protein 2 [Ignavibacteria bacterium GWA2_35_8]OGU41372.1 MAG: penicillin-binding protein 2 [Ignavibacteria bacterium GWB2_35_12]OGV19451.1 MAG: penicillin-binding protein 2 [Ignavibacteria bacterium RIFOXYC2_FULL_35_21]